MYLLLFLAGSIGYLLMTLLGFMHGGGVRGHAMAAHAGHAHAALPGHHGAHLGHARGAVTPHTGTQPSKWSVVGHWLAVTPLDIFCMAMGAGAAGMLLQSVLSAKALVFAAILGALVFDLGVIRPIMSALMRFVSKPSAGLEGTVANSAKAITNFDDAGRGIIELCLDGQNVQLLAMLEAAELHLGARVKKGDEVVVIEVDSGKNTCRVTAEL